MTLGSTPVALESTPRTVESEIRRSEPAGRSFAFLQGFPGPAEDRSPGSLPARLVPQHDAVLRRLAGTGLAPRALEVEARVGADSPPRARAPGARLVIGEPESRVGRHDAAAARAGEAVRNKTSRSALPARIRVKACPRLPVGVESGRGAQRREGSCRP